MRQVRQVRQVRGVHELCVVHVMRAVRVRVGKGRGAYLESSPGSNHLGPATYSPRGPVLCGASTVVRLNPLGWKS